MPRNKQGSSKWTITIIATTVHTVDKKVKGGMETVYEPAGFKAIKSDDTPQTDANGKVVLPVYTITTEQAKAWLAGGIEFTNLTMTKDKKLWGVGGDLDNYTVVDISNPQREQPKGKVTFVLLGTTNTKKGLMCRVCGYNGVEVSAPAAAVASRCPLANAKIAPDEDGKPKVLRLSGTYEDEYQPKPKHVASQPVKPAPSDLEEGKVKNPSEPAPPPPPSTLQTPYSIISPYNLRESYTGIDISNEPDKQNPKITLEQKLVRATRLTLRLWSSFYFSLYKNMHLIVSRDIETMGVNTKEFIINPDFLGKLTEEELMFVIYHELGHVFYGHTARRGERDPELWNVACDLIVNSAISEQFSELGFTLTPGTRRDVRLTSLNPPIKGIAMPDNCLFDEKIKASETSVEIVYADLVNDMRKSMSDAYFAGLDGGATQNGTFEIKNDNQGGDYVFDYRLGAETALADMADGYTTLDAYKQGTEDGKANRPKANVSSYAPAEQEAYDYAYECAVGGDPLDFAELYFDNWGAYWRGTAGFETGYSDVMLNMSSTYQSYESGDYDVSKQQKH